MPDLTGATNNLRGNMDYHFVFQIEKLWFKEVHGLTQGPPVSAWFSLPLYYGRELVL